MNQRPSRLRAIRAATSLAFLLAGCGATPTIQLWSPPGVSSDLYESHPAIDPRTGDFYFVRSQKDFSGWEILVTRCTDHGWRPPERAAFAGAGVEADPFFTPDGKSVYFISTRATGSHRSKDLDIYRVDRAEDGTWREPIRLPPPVNSQEAEWFPRPSSDGWLYFGSNRIGGIGKNDIWRTRKDAKSIWMIENLGAAINSTEDEYEPLPSPDGRRLLVERNDGIYESLLKKGTWSPRKKLGGSINVNGSEIGAFFSPNGRALLFSRDTKSEKSGEIFLWSVAGKGRKWPPACPAIDP